MEYGKDFYQYLCGDEHTNGYKIKYLTGPDIVGLGKHFEFPYSYSWKGGMNLSRWDYMRKLIDHIESKINLDSFFHFYFQKIIQPNNVQSDDQKNFFIDINKRLIPYGQKLIIEDRKIKIKLVKANTILDTVDLDLSDAETTSHDYVEEALNSGGQANILTTPSDDILLKRLNLTKATTEKQKERFNEEFRLLKLLDNKYTLEVFDLDESKFEYTMKKASGDFYLLAKNMSSADIVQFLFQIAEAIDYIHCNNIMHRDIKPENCLFVNSRWVLADFGLSKGDDSPELTTTGAVWGTPTYIHPDLYNDPKLWKKDYKPMFDYYSFGILINNTLPYVEKTNIRDLLSGISLGLTNSSSKTNIKSIIKELKQIFVET